MRKFRLYLEESNIGNIPHLRENILLICLAYGFSGFNCILTGVCTFHTAASVAKAVIILGIVFVCMVPVSFFDRRKGMCGMLNVILTCIMHLLLSLAASCYYSIWWMMVVYAGEAVCAVIAVLICVKMRHNRKIRK